MRASSLISAAVLSTLSLAAFANDAREVSCAVVVSNTRVLAYASDAKTGQMLNTMKKRGDYIDVWSNDSKNQGVLFKHCQEALRGEIPKAQINRVLSVINK